MAKADLLVLFLLSFMFFVNAQFEYFQMVQQWPRSTCRIYGVTCPTIFSNMFTIHGLWPSNFSGATLVCPGTSVLNPASQLAAIRQQLNTYWPNVVGGTNEDFWTHEWNDHGRCSSPPFNEFQYFQITLNIRTNPNYDLLAILNAARLGPTAANPQRQYQDIEHAIEAAIGKKPALRCKRITIPGQGLVLLLNEIVLCFNRDGVTLIDCPRSAVSCRGSSFLWFSHED